MLQTHVELTLLLSSGNHIPGIRGNLLAWQAQLQNHAPCSHLVGTWAVFDCSHQLILTASLVQMLSIHRWLAYAHSN